MTLRARGFEPSNLTLHGEGIKVDMPRTVADKLAVIEFGRHLEKRDERYGLQSDEAFDREYGAPEKMEFIVARKADGSTILGDFRLRFHYDLSRFDNLSPQPTDDYREGLHIVDIGGHIDRPDHERLPVFLWLWAYLWRILERTDVAALYGQSRPRLLKNFAQIGFSVCSPTFEVAGWSGPWQSIYLPFDDYRKRWNDATYQEAHLARTDTPLATDFLRDVERILQDSPRWRTCGKPALKLP